MKINYTNPKTDKTSTVILPDHWVKVYLAVMVNSWKDYDKPPHQREAIQGMVKWCADKYFDPCNSNHATSWLPAPSQSTFTKYLECYMASHVFSRAALPYAEKHGFKEGDLFHD